MNHKDRTRLQTAGDLKNSFNEKAKNHDGSNTWNKAKWKLTVHTEKTKTKNIWCIEGKAGAEQPHMGDNQTQPAQDCKHRGIK